MKLVVAVLEITMYHCGMISVEILYDWSMKFLQSFLRLACKWLENKQQKAVNWIWIIHFRVYVSEYLWCYWYFSAWNNGRVAGFIIYRVRVRRGGRKRPAPKGQVYGKPKSVGINQLKNQRSLQAIAEVLYALLVNIQHLFYITIIELNYLICKNFILFLPREAMLSAVYAVVVCLCVCHTPVLYQNG